MEAKRLNFNRPLLSVRRRFSPTVSNSQKESKRKNAGSIPALVPSSSCNSELLSGPLRDPGTVPFVWEQSPGRPKPETKTQKPSVAPNLPPGRSLSPKKQDYDVVSRVENNDSFEDFKKERSHSWNDNDDDGNGDICRESGKPQVTYGPNFLQFIDDDNEVESDFDYDEHGNMPFKFCGLLPHFCLRGSIGMLNPTPGLSVRTNRSRVGSSSATSQDARVAAYEHKSSIKQQKDQKTTQSHKSSDNHNESSPTLVSEVNTQKKGLVSFKELLAQEKEKEAEFENPAVEKTLYVDTVETFDSDFKKNDVDILGISYFPSEPFGCDLVADKLKHDKQMIKHTRDHKVDQKVKVSKKTGSGLPAPPPLPNSPSDSWLCRTLPAVNSKNASLFSNHKLSSNATG